MDMAWGVDSANQASIAHGGIFFWDAVVRMAGMPPAFWGRYIGGLYALDLNEVNFLHSRGCKIAVVYNGATNSQASVGGGTNEGTVDAGNAVRAATALGIPSGVCIYADIEMSWQVSPSWLQGWATEITSQNYVPGFYCNPLPMNIFNSSYSHAAGQEPAVAGSLIYSNEHNPNPQCRCGAAAPPFNPAQPSGSGNTVLWQYSINCPVHGMPSWVRVDMDLASDAALAAMW
jgi:Domain of unknown function (DUF1906)